MLIAFDGTTLNPGRTGVGYYTEHLLQHLAREVVNTGDEIVVVSNKPIDTQSPLPAHVRVHDGHRFPVRIGWMQLRAASALGALRPDIAHFTNGMMPIGSPVATVVTVHDMSLRLYPKCHPVRRLLLNRPLMNIAIERAASIVTVSNSARRDLLRLHGLPPDRVAVVHEAASPEFRPIDDRALLESMRARYGRIQRGNHRRCCRACRLCCNRGIGAMTAALPQRYCGATRATSRTSSCESVSRRGDENARAARLAPHTLIGSAGLGAVVVAREELAVIDPELAVE